MLLHCSLAAPMRIGNKPDGMTARAAPPAQGQAPKPVQRHRGFVFLMIAACLVIAAFATILAVSWPNVQVPGFTKRTDAASKKPSGHVIISRTNSELCDHYVLDNTNGAMKAVETLPCSGKRPDPNIADRVNSFSQSWRGGR
jgi:hypothetical protein